MNKWYIPDAFYPGVNSGNTYISHEAICFLNVYPHEAEVKLSLYFEDREKMTGFTAVIPGERTLHLRMDKIVSDKGETVPKDTPYAILIESESDLKIQYTRVDTTQAELAISTTMV